MTYSVPPTLHSNFQSLLGITIKLWTPRRFFFVILSVFIFLFTGNSSITSTVSVESHCLQNGTWTLVDLTCVPNEGFLLNPNSGDLNSHDKNGFLVGLTQNSGNVHSSVSTPVLLIFVVIITVILGMALSTLILVARRWYAKMTFDYSPQHFILATGNR